MKKKGKAAFKPKGDMHRKGDKRLGEPKGGGKRMR